MRATAPSRILNKIGIIIMKICLVMFIVIKNLVSKDINKCPATMFAASRTDKVIGRIMILVNSINTMKFIKGTGVPCGVR
jgi:hypothetical protein